MNKFTVQKSFAISAGAGSGKTYTLSRRYINALLGFDYFRECYEVEKISSSSCVGFSEDCYKGEGQDNCSFKHESFFQKKNPAKVNQIVTITFTEAAALEMKGRIFELIAKIINYDKLCKTDTDFESIKKANEYSQDHLEYVRETLSQAYTQSANAKISTIHAYCLDIIKSNADIAQIDTKLEIIKDDEKQKLLDKIVFDILNKQENESIIFNISKDLSVFFISDLIKKYVSNKKFRDDYENFSQNSIDKSVYKKLICELYPLPEITKALQELENDTVRKEWFKKFYDNFVNFEAVEWKAVDLKTSPPSMGKKTFPVSDNVKKTLEVIYSSGAYSCIDDTQEELFFEKIVQLKTLLDQIKAKYDEELANLDKIDFDTIITKTLEIIPKVKTDFKYIMVDEFQDTNAIQFDIVKSSCNPDTNLFVVGDAKQAIYSFQGAEIEVFNDAINNTDLFSSVELMSKNHRSDGVVLCTVNKIFRKLLQKDKHLTSIRQNYEARPQDLCVFDAQRSKNGSFRYLITSQKYQDNEQEKLNELDTIARFISEIYHGQQDNYMHITDFISTQEKAIAVVFDSSSKMLELKQKLQQRGITAKVSASENFYHTKEINDIFNVLKAIEILLSSKKTKHFNASQKYYLAGAMRSNILRCDDNSIKEYLENEDVCYNLKKYVEVAKKSTFSQLVKYIYDDSNLYGVYAHFADIDQRVANLNKFLLFCIEYENSDGQNLYKFLALLENAIYFSENKEDEAFFKSESTKSIEICTIHYTKGLAYPMVILANADKGLYSQITSNSLKHNNFTFNNEQKELVGFKINDYTPLSHRVLKEIDKRKHLAEKKRLLYVALTRAKHDVVISAFLKKKKDGDISLRKDSYLNMICDSLNIDLDHLFQQNKDYCINLLANDIQISKKDIKYVQHTFKKIEFELDKVDSATANSAIISEDIDNIAATLGTLTHKIIELYWADFKENGEIILDKMMVFKQEHRNKIMESMKKFYESNVYTMLQSGVEHIFELEFNIDNKTGFIDLIYFDASKNKWIIIDFKTGNQTQEKIQKYAIQLEFYSDVVKKMGYENVEAEILWL